MAKARQDITAIAYDKRGRIISIGRNNYLKTHPLQAKFSKHTDNPFRVYLHAELDAIIKARGRQIHKLVVIRVDRFGKERNAKPCECCQRAIKEFGVKHIEHT